jgi:hypothetical protein
LSTPSTTPTVYVPNNEDAKYQHEKSFYVDVIGKDLSGIKEIRTHVTPDGYEFINANTAGQVFQIPKFTWDTNVASSITTIKEVVLVGTSNNALVDVEYNTNSAGIVHSKDLGSPVAGIIFGENTNKAYISTTANVSSYAVSYYANSASEMYQVLSVANTDGAIISTYRKSDNSLWAIQSYNGKVAKMDPDDLSVIKTYDNFDAPYKIRYSSFHNVYFVAGSHILWKIDNLDVITSVYEINDYILKDFDVSESGLVCMLFKGNTNDIIRIVSNDLYTFVLDKKVDNGKVAFCKYCGKGIFYVLNELGTGSAIYSCIHYVYDSSTNILRQASSEDVLSFTSTTTTLGVTSRTIQITSPISGSLQIGQTYDVRWISSKSVNDSVKIELYKGNVLYDTLSSNSNNTGIFSWKVGETEEGENYAIKVTWLAASSDPNNYDLGGVFSILKNIQTTTTTTTTRLTERAIGIDYSSASDQILIILASGNYMVFVLASMTGYGLLSLGILNPTAMATRSMVVGGNDLQSKVRIFVGSQMYFADKWDSGIIDTDLKSMYYGGGPNLVQGEKYYAHIQTYSEKYGWSEIQISEFVVPK